MAGGVEDSSQAERCKIPSCTPSIRDPMARHGALVSAFLAAGQVQSDDWYESGFHTAAFDSTFGIERPVFLRYELPASVLQPPIQASPRLFVNPSQRRTRNYSAESRGTSSTSSVRLEHTTAPKTQTCPQTLHSIG